MVEKVTEIKLSGKSDLLIRKALSFSRSFEHVSILTSNHYPDNYGKYKFLAAFGGYRLFEPDHNPFKALRDFFESRPSWLFGHFNYDLKNQIEDLTSSGPKKFDFQEVAFFEPAYLMLQKRGSDSLELYSNFEVDPLPVKNFANRFVDHLNIEPKFQPIPKMKARVDRSAYLESIEKLKEEIQYGNIYEINYCQEFFAENVNLDPHLLFIQLNQKSPMPFSGFYRLNHDYLVCASPERYLCKRDNKLISQPIKGTAKRGSNIEEDQSIKEQLKNDLKEQTENVMIVDLVRNDLSRTAEKSSVKVEELFGVYSFPQVHQLISTVKSTLSGKYHFSDAIKYSFPMGSMTGAPKISAMKLIEKHEESRRELYSGSIGYIDPYGDFDFNVVIRSLLYSAANKYLSLSVGGAITNQSIPENEYEECLLKAKAIFEQQVKMHD